ncbi:DUF5990 family protein [Pollutibacter soli]|uniref:DUF5990 family protein n=1 Tax=Pollutibacter soli TaxID=3034157 RepID=UPI003013EF67
MINGEINIRIILELPPPGICFALQSGSGPGYTVLQTQWSDGGNIIFETQVSLKESRAAGVAFDFSGTTVQGKAGERFFYIDIGTYAGDMKSTWARRLKIPLTGVDKSTIQSLEKDPTFFLETVVPGTGKDGGPNCATVKPFTGWKVKSMK